MIKSASWYRNQYQDRSGNLLVTTSTDDTTLITIGNATYNTIYIQRIIFFVSTDAAASMQFEDSAGSPIETAFIPASPGDSTRWDFDFGDVGVPLTQGKNFVMDVSATGLAGQLVWEAYEKRTVVGAP